MKLLKLIPVHRRSAIRRQSAPALLLIVVLFFSGCQKFFDSAFPGHGNPPTSKDDAAVAKDWYQLQLKMILASSPAKSNLATIRLFAYSGISLFEATRFGLANSKSLEGQLVAMPAMPQPEKGKKYSWIIAANAALANITRDIFPAPSAENTSSVDSLEKVYMDKITVKEGADLVSRSQAFGASVAAAIYSWAQTDLFNHTGDPYIPPVFPGAWVPTPPAFAPAAGPYFGNCRTFMKAFSESTTPAPPYEYSEDPASDFYQMVNHNYTISKTLTADQKNIAFFWNDVGAGIGYTPMGHCISILTQVLDKSHAPLTFAAIAYAKAGIAMWDASIVCWRSKFKYTRIRPVSYIQKLIDSTWVSLIGTPPHPEYPAAHAFITSSVMRSISSVFGNNYSFIDHTYDFLGYSPRSYSSFDDAALECGQSRVYGGIHYQESVDVGHHYGDIIGQAAAALQFSW